ncbi:Swi3-domain-containing protein [Ceratobasidium sp. AG-I]|nr:Swi3-domain-containing protein [Ceratobasidium sp. AG-I]
MSALNDIWDDDDVQIARPTPKHTSSKSRALSSDSEGDRRASGSRPSKRARTNKPLFNPDSDEEDGPGQEQLPPDIDALFEGLDDDDMDMALPPQLDINQLQRETDKRVAVEAAKKRLMRGETDVLGEKMQGKVDEKEKAVKTKRIIPKLDEQRLLDRDGLPALVRHAKEFKVKGKGHELSDLNRLMQMYQLWAHKMFPKMQFHDTVDRVERLCRSKRMHVALSTWRDIENAPAHEDIGSDNGDADEEAAAQHPPTSSPARITLEPGGPSVRQSQANAEADEDDEEAWRDMMEAMESQSLAKQKSAEAAPSVPSARKEPEEDLGGYDEDDWAAMDEMDEAVDLGKTSTEQVQPVNPKVPQPEESSDAASPPGPDHDVSSDAPPEPAGPSEDDDDEDDFYAMYEP